MSKWLFRFKNWWIGGTCPGGSLQLRRHSLKADLPEIIEYVLGIHRSMILSSNC